MTATMHRRSDEVSAKLAPGFLDSEAATCAPETIALSVGTYQENAVFYWGVTLGCAVVPNSADVASTSLFIGQQIGDAGAVRQTYIDTVAGLDPTDSAGRTAAKIAARADTPPLVGGVIQGVRPGTGPNPGSVGSANVTNPGVNSLGQTLRIGGTILVIGGLTYDAIDIFTSPNPARTATGALGGWVGAYYGGLGGTLAGTAARPGVGTIIGGVGGAALGGYLGRQGALDGYDRANPPPASAHHGAGGTW